MISAAQSITSENKLEQKLETAQTLCEQVLSHVREVNLVLENVAEERVTETTFDTTFLEEEDWISFYFQSHLCIGGVKMTMTVKDMDDMLPEAKRIFEHLVSSS